MMVDVSETPVSFLQHLDDTELISRFADFLAVGLEVPVDFLFDDLPLLLCRVHVFERL